MFGEQLKIKTEPTTFHVWETSKIFHVGKQLKTNLNSLRESSWLKKPADKIFFFLWWGTWSNVFMNSEAKIFLMRNYPNLVQGFCCSEPIGARWLWEQGWKPHFCNCKKKSDYHPELKENEKTRPTYFEHEVFKNENEVKFQWKWSKYLQKLSFLSVTPIMIKMSHQALWWSHPNPWRARLERFFCAQQYENIIHNFTN